jgi:hypothetical protein
MSHLLVYILTMHFSTKFCRIILLLLSLTLSAQAMAVASFGACHRMKALALIAVHHVTLPTSHHHVDSAAHDGAAMHHAESSSTVPADDGSRVSCAACAACHVSSFILNDDSVTAHIPVASPTVFQDNEVARARNVASGLDRPPRA